MNSVTALLADDEPALLDYLKSQLEQAWPDLKVIAMAPNGIDALRLIGELEPDIAFLDIRMPGLSGLDVASRLAAQESPTQMVFVTAYDQYAVDAFQREAIDYLLKPVTAERLQQTVLRLQRRFSAPEPVPAAPGQEVAEVLARLTQQLGLGSMQRLTWIRAASGAETRLIPVDEVVYFDARDKYVSVFTEHGEFLIRTPIKELLESLDPERFWQIHRGTIVAASCVMGTVRDFRGRTCVKFKSHADRPVVSRAWLHLFKQM